MVWMADEVGLLGTLSSCWRGLPLVVAVGREQAPAAGERFPERGLLADGFRPRVDHPAADGDVLGPGRDQAPSNDPQLAGGRRRSRVPVRRFLTRRASHHRVDRLGWRHVVVRLEWLIDAIPLHGELLEELDARTR